MAFQTIIEFVAHGLEAMGIVVVSILPMVFEYVKHVRARRAA